MALGRPTYLIFFFFVISASSLRRVCPSTLSPLSPPPWLIIDLTPKVVRERSARRWTLGTQRTTPTSRTCTRTPMAPTTRPWPSSSDTRQLQRWRKRPKMAISTLSLADLFPANTSQSSRPVAICPSTRNGECCPTAILGERLFTDHFIQ